MELHARFSTSSRRVALAAGLTALLAIVAGLLSSAPEAAAKSRSKAPVVSSISPSRVNIGENLTIRGRHFRRGKNRNTVVFKRDGARAIFVKADISTTKMMRVTASAKLSEFLAIKDGTPQFTRFRVRVLSERFGRSFTRLSISPSIGPEAPPAPARPAAAAASGDCDSDGQLNGTDADDDNDLLSDADEAKLRTDGCKLDSDADGVGDGYEFKSALDLNDDEYRQPNLSMPYPEKRPYPNALYADAQLDFDGDGLTLGEEHKLWREQGRPQAGLGALSYSDGLQYSVYERYDGDRRRGTIAAAGYDKQTQFLDWARDHGYRVVRLPDGLFHDIRDFNRSAGAATPSGVGLPAATADKETVVTPEVYYNSELHYYDFDEDDLLSDDERDEDADGLTNYDESHGRLRAEFWRGCYSKEVGYPVPYAGTDLADPDTDGDGVLDGADDQDHDDIPNLMEMSRNAASGRAIVNSCNDRDAVESMSRPNGWVNPFNPCLPATDSRTCSRHPDLASPFTPFDPQGKRYYVLN